MTDETSEATKRLGEWAEAGRGREWAIRYAFQGTAATVELTWNDDKDCGSCFAIRTNAEEAVYAALYDYAEQTINSLKGRVKELEGRQTNQAELSQLKVRSLFCIGTGRFVESYERSYVWIESGAKELERAVEAFKAKHPGAKANSVQRVFDSDCKPFVSALSDSGFDFI